MTEQPDVTVTFTNREARVVITALRKEARSRRAKASKQPDLVHHGKLESDRADLLDQAVVQVSAAVQDADRRFSQSLLDPSTRRFA